MNPTFLFSPKRNPTSRCIAIYLFRLVLQTEQVIDMLWESHFHLNKDLELYGSTKALMLGIHIFKYSCFLNYMGLEIMAWSVLSKTTLFICVTWN